MPGCGVFGRYLYSIASEPAELNAYSSADLDFHEKSGIQSGRPTGSRIPRKIRHPSRLTSAIARGRGRSLNSNLIHFYGPWTLTG